MLARTHPTPAARMAAIVRSTSVREVPQVMLDTGAQLRTGRGGVCLHGHAETGSYKQRQHEAPAGHPTCACSPMRRADPNGQPIGVG